MARKVSAMIVLLLFAAMLVSAPALAAKASPQGKLSDRALELQNLPMNKILGAEQVESIPGLPNKATNFYNTSLGFAPPNAFQIGATYLDYQSNGSIGRQIVEGGGWVHSFYMDLPAASTANRVHAYFAWEKGTATTNGAGDVDGAAGAGYGDIDFDAAGGGAAVIAYHNVSAGFATKAGRDFGVGIASFNIISFANVAGVDLSYPPATCGDAISGTD